MMADGAGRAGDNTLLAGRMLHAPIVHLSRELSRVYLRFDVDEDPVGAWQGANGIAYVDNETGQTITAIDTETLEVIRTYDLRFMPGMAALGPDDRLWVTDATGGGVAFFATDSDTKLGEVGNSGNSDEPHLHVHAQRPGRPWDLFTADPLPVRFDGRYLVRNDRVTGPPRRSEIIDD